MLDPCLIQFPKLGSPETVYISVMKQLQLLPFAVRRIFWTYHTPADIIQGHHAHLIVEQVFSKVACCITVTTELPDGTTQKFCLEDPRVGLYVPPYVWQTICYSHSAVLLALASSPYDAQSYIRNYDDFKCLGKKEANPESGWPV